MRTNLYRTRSEVRNLLVGVNGTSFVKQSLGICRLLCLIFVINPLIHECNVLSLLLHLERMDGVFLSRLILLEVALHLEGAVLPVRHAETIILIHVARSVRAGIVVYERVCVCRLRTKARSRDKFLIGVGSEACCDFADGVAEC